MEGKARGAALSVVAAALALLLMAGVTLGTALGGAPLETLPGPSAAAGTGHQAGRQAVDINRATEEELTALPGIGPARAAAIVADREENGPFRYPEDLLRVPGIGEKTLEGLLELITVD